MFDAWLHDVVPEAYEAVAPARGPSQHSLGGRRWKEKGAAHIELVSVDSARAVGARVEDGRGSPVHGCPQDRGPVVTAEVPRALPRRGREHNAASRGQVVAHEHHDAVVIGARVGEVLRKCGGRVPNVDLVFGAWMVKAKTTGERAAMLTMARAVSGPFVAAPPPTVPMRVP